MNHSAGHVRKIARYGDLHPSGASRGVVDNHFHSVAFGIESFAKS
jgi:hypothetical protein